ncbi:hypothetical protein BK816_07525 [Boudabousia tangfeifanii]|uniref:Uncharacterized protein n=1 Tax=Boudabousia tangfeifanii TaxID=1912795 RepID=A0A1D9MLY9_9ACTO|nr:DUF2797 domain-containing protein [Boudabousia tangfeifanii]AOZ73160.1 hypothetical protein BK816_07525 [Boudabousia tangfeifanii]
MKTYLLRLSADQSETKGNWRTLPETPNATGNEGETTQLHAEVESVPVFAAGHQLSGALTGARRCIGSQQLQPDGTFAYVPCRTARIITKGKQCFPCSRADESRLIHHTPREKASPALIKYLDVPHFLYVAGFADGTWKVGTSRLARGENRWVEQGAVVAIRVAQYEDGWQVRAAEDATSTNLDFTQAVRSSRKAKSFLPQTSLSELVLAACEKATEVKNFLQGQAPDEEMDLFAPLALGKQSSPETNPELAGVTPEPLNQDSAGAKLFAETLKNQAAKTNGRATANQGTEWDWIIENQLGWANPAAQPWLDKPLTALPKGTLNYPQTWQIEAVFGPTAILRSLDDEHGEGQVVDLGALISQEWELNLPASH